MHGPAASAGFSVEGFTAQTINFLGHTDEGYAHIRYGNQPGLEGGRVSDFPDDLVGTGHDDDGDVWLDPVLPWQGTENLAMAGNAHWHLVLHETGHALGLKHGHHDYNGFEALPHEVDSYEFTLMTYRTFVGSNPARKGHWASVGDQDFPQSFMMLDIAALQHIYGANFTINSEDTVYSWTPGSGDTLVNGEVGIDAAGSTIFATLWDGGGFDTYDLSAFTTDLVIDLSPGSGSVFSADQLSHLGLGHYARANIYNALQYEGDARSLIEMAIGGSGDDIFIGNDADNIFYGGRGDDHFDGGGGADNRVTYDGAREDYAISQNADGSLTVSHDIWGTDTLINIDRIVFSKTEAWFDAQDIISDVQEPVISRKIDVTGLSSEHIEENYDGNDIIQIDDFYM